MLRDKTWIIARGSSADRVDALRSVEVESPRAPVAQLDRVLVSEAKGHRFDSCRARQSLHAVRCSCFRCRSPVARPRPTQHAGKKSILTRPSPGKCCDPTRAEENS